MKFKENFAENGLNVSYIFLQLTRNPILGHPISAQGSIFINKMILYNLSATKLSGSKHLNFISCHFKSSVNERLEQWPTSVFYAFLTNLPISGPQAASVPKRKMF
jgi:hypothetical protein